MTNYSIEQEKINKKVEAILRTIRYIQDGEKTLTVTNGQYRKISSPALSSGRATGTKTKVKLYTTASMKRLKTAIMSCPHNIKNNSLKMITLTYQHNPDSHKDAKRDLDNFMKRMQRYAPAAFHIWKLEYQKRGTIHFHILSYNLQFTQELPFKVAKMWNEITGQGEKALLAGTRIEAVKHPLYICKYEAKPEKNEYKGLDNPGRFWGIVNRKAYDAAVDKREINLTKEEYIIIKRFIRKQLKKYLKCKTNKADIISRLTSTTIFKVEKMLLSTEQKKIKKPEVNKCSMTLSRPIKPTRIMTQPIKPAKPKLQPMRPAHCAYKPVKAQSISAHTG